MKKIKELDKIYDQCMADGIIRKKEEIDIELAKTLLDSAKKELELSKKIEKIAKYYSVFFKGKYDILRELITAYLLFDKVKIDNHQCVNAYLCTKHPELEVDWKILEILRIIRNGIYYEGKQIEESAWKTHKIQFEIYIKTFIKEVEQKIKKN